MSSSSSKDEKGLDSNDSSDSGTDSHQQTWQPSKLTLADTAIVRTYLMRALRQPAELADIILDYASYGPRVEACREKPFYAPANRVQSVITTQLSRKPRVALRKRTGRDKVAVTTTYTGPTSATAALCLVTDPIPKGRWPGEKVKVKKIRFSMWSRDQGWGGDPQCKGEYLSLFDQYQTLCGPDSGTDSTSQQRTVAHTAGLKPSSSVRYPLQIPHLLPPSRLTISLTLPSPAKISRIPP